MNGEVDVVIPELSATQWKAIRFLSRSEHWDRQVAGYGAAPLLSGCRALVRRKLARPGWKTGYYGLTDAGRLLIDEAMKRKPTRLTGAA